MSLVRVESVALRVECLNKKGAPWDRATAGTRRMRMRSLVSASGTRWMIFVYLRA